MKKHKRKPSQSKPSKKLGNPISDPLLDPDIERTAKELDTLARQRLPDGVLQGDLTGCEAEIRQDSILLALSWYLRGLRDDVYRAKYPWIPARAIAKALRIHKRDRLKALAKHLKNCSGLPSSVELSSLHPAMIRPSDWSSSTMVRVVEEAIVTALRREMISSVNALIAMEVFVCGTSVKEISEQLGMNRSNIYQHLHRTKKITKVIIDRIEVPLMDPM
jgi:Sigma-70, region 4